VPRYGIRKGIDAEGVVPTEDFSFSKFASNPFYRNQNARLIDLAELGSGQRIVDLACGTGGVTRLISERLRGARDSVIIGIDHSAGALRQAMDDLKDVHAAALQFVQSQVEQVSEAITESVDTVFFCNAIHYVSNKDELLADISKTLKPGGQLAFNTSFFDGAHPPETVLFARKWMLRALRTLRRDYGISPVKSAKVESRKQLTPDEYRDLVEGNGFKITKQRIEKVQVPLDGWLDISGFQDFIEGVMPGVPLDKARAALQSAVRETLTELNVDQAPRNWLDVVAVRV
jgi:ubiquinone/menaquinone biosynthesis C-methylase UbiE